MTKAALAAALAFGINPLYAGSGHDHDHGHNHAHTEITEAKAKEIAHKQLAHFVAKEKLSKSWSSVPLANIEQKKFKSGLEWVISYKNSQEKDPKKETLYIFVNRYGELTGANFSGQ